MPESLIATGQPEAHHGWMLMSAVRLLRAGLLAALLTVGASTSVLAQSAPLYDSSDGCGGSWQRRFGVDLLILDCQPGFATAHDRAYMYLRSRADTAGDWRSQLNFTDSVWLFDAGARGKASLIVEFHRTPAGQVADLYDDTRGDGEVRYGLERGIPRSIQSRFPTVRVTAPDGWWVRDGRINFNLKIEVDGAVKAAPDADIYADYMRNDGVVDAIVDVVDATGEGRPTTEVRQIKAIPDQSSSLVRTLAWTSIAGSEPPIGTYIFWPYLGYFGAVQPSPGGGVRTPLRSIDGAAYGFVKNRGVSFPPIQVDWGRARIDTLGELVASRTRPGLWSIRSYVRFGESGLEQADLENPLALYDLAGANDGRADLVIRDEFYLANDIFGPAVVPLPNHDVSYSWDQEHDGSWSYKLGVYGRRPMPATVDLGGGVKVQSVPYQELPRWVVENAWDAATFVASEGANAFDPTGIGLGCTGCSPALAAYHSGYRRDRPTEILSDVSPGYRTEVAFDLNDVPQLYLSSVDGRLHLYKAQGGSWGRSANETIAMQAIGESFLNRWERVVGGTSVDSLTHLADRYIYQDPGGVSIAAAPAAASLFMTRAPTSRDELLQLRASLADVHPPPVANPADLFAQAQGPRQSLPGAVTWDPRPVAGGFRFILRLSAPVPDVDWAAQLVPGTYAVSYNTQRGFSAAPARPAQINVADPLVKGDAPIELVPTRVSAELRNDGDQDASAVPVAIFAGRPNAAGQLVAWTTVDVPAGRSAVADVNWTPPLGGDWELQAAVLDDRAATSSRVAVVVAAGPSPDVANVLAAQGLRPFTGGAISASLTLMMAAAVGLGFVVWQAGRTTPRDS